VAVVVVVFAQVVVVQADIAQALPPLIPTPSTQSLSVLVVLVAMALVLPQGLKVRTLYFFQPLPQVADMAQAQT
jgi:hypothetical protein